MWNRIKQLLQLVKCVLGGLNGRADPESLYDSLLDPSLILLCEKSNLNEIIENFASGSIAVIDERVYIGVGHKPTCALSICEYDAWSFWNSCRWEQSSESSEWVLEISVARCEQEAIDLPL